MKKFVPLVSLLLCAGCPQVLDLGNYSPCPGECIPLPPLGFDGPALLWTGSEMEAPECPARAPQVGYEGYKDLDDSNQCSTCKCSEPRCELPGGLTASDTAMCQGPKFTPFDAPPSWDGSCTSPTTVTSNDFRSYSIAPLTVTACVPVDDTVPQKIDGDSPWKTFGRACQGEPVDNVCGDPGMTCMPTAEPPPPGFRQCIMYLRDGEPKCPANYPDLFVFYERLNDTRDCTPCQCTEDVPSVCAASISTYQDSNCTTPLGTNLQDTVADSDCYGAGMMGVELGSMTAQFITNQPGTCTASGGDPVGEAIPEQPTAFCCQAPPAQ